MHFATIIYLLFPEEVTAGGELGTEVGVVVAPVRDSGARHMNLACDVGFGSAGEEEGDGLVLFGGEGHREERYVNDSGWMRFGEAGKRGRGEGGNAPSPNLSP